MMDCNHLKKTMFDGTPLTHKLYDSYKLYYCLFDNVTAQCEEEDKILTSEPQPDELPPEETLLEKGKQASVCFSCEVIKQ